jgi:hypothetical protein
VGIRKRQKEKLSLSLSEIDQARIKALETKDRSKSNGLLPELPLANI